METNKKVGILGYGEVGKAIASFYPWDRLYVEDLNASTVIPTGAELEVLHICIPCKVPEVFIETVRDTIHKHAMGALVFIHSTVPVGTTAKVAEQLTPFVVHSPVRGVHPNLAEGIRTFPKFVGADDPGAGRLAYEHLELLGITPMVVHKTRTTELMKLLDTTYYGLCIAFHDYAKKLCEREGVSFDMVMTEANRTYNKGYGKLGKSNVIRPVLTPPEGGKIGGHCVIPNAELLLEQYGDDAILETILRHK